MQKRIPLLSESKNWRNYYCKHLGTVLRVAFVIPSRLFLGAKCFVMAMEQNISALPPLPIIHLNQNSIVRINIRCNGAIPRSNLFVLYISSFLIFIIIFDSKGFRNFGRNYRRIAIVEIWVLIFLLLCDHFQYYFWWPLYEVSGKLSNSQKFRTQCFNGSLHFRAIGQRKRNSWHAVCLSSKPSSNHDSA